MVGLITYSSLYAKCTSAVGVCSPFAVKEDVAKHHHFNLDLWKHPLQQMGLEQVLARLTDSPANLAKELNPFMAELWKDGAQNGLLQHAALRSQAGKHRRAWYSSIRWMWTALIN